MCAILLVTQIDMFFAKKLLSTYYSLLEAMNVERIVNVLEQWYAQYAKDSRFDVIDENIDNLGHRHQVDREPIPDDRRRGCLLNED